MSTTYNAAAVVGCQIPRSKIFFTRKERGCGHAPNVKKDPKFCPECGESWWKNVSCVHPQYDSNKATFCGLKVFDDKYTNYVFVAIHSVDTDICADIPSTKLNIKSAEDSERRKLRSVLTPLGLWDVCGVAKNGWGNMYHCKTAIRDGPICQGSVIIRYDDEGIKDLKMKCKCKTKKLHPYEVMTFYCTNPRCGRIWVNEFCGNMRRTEMFHRVSEPLNGVWVGHTFFAGARLSAGAYVI